ncbi:hypothetical protein QYE76_038949 [Lolium multiflorum]|uniref:Reverse transcriptase domain-containing protein n=1 Tax=Lolium multiflorum TaxID=4521 RepID=A0AAD8TAI7_LOLMU|nr:hypothetical protein QYE76_038949 [Lolium multiflorum]
MHTACARLKTMAGSLKDWSVATFGSVRREITRLERSLRSLRNLPTTDRTLAEEKRVERQLCELFEREEIMARQRSRVEWLREGDRNTAFFHSKATIRRKTNRIEALTRENGSVSTDETEIKVMVHNWCEKLFTSEPITATDVILEAIPSKVDAQMNVELCKAYTNEEIKTALFQMGPTKAPGPDGFPAMFYQVHWELVENMVCEAVRSFLGGDEIPDGFCDSVIVLIPKVTNAKHLSKFRPISLCNVLYKIASKVVANRLKLLLPDIISEYQSAFVPGRLITDSALIAYESLHTVRRQRGKHPFFALKIDMMKAYDRIEWAYLHDCLTKLGFADSWINSVMRCVTSARYAVKVNGALTSPVVPSRGIRQGDPISPYLFLLCTEGLSCLMQKKEGLGELPGLRNGRQGPSISHLLFADDSIFFARSDPRSVETLKSVLKSYCEASGQKVNLQKSSIFFGNKCQDSVKLMVKDKLEVSNEVFQDTYLGMPTEIVRATTASFKFLADRVWKRASSGSGRPLSRAGKEYEDWEKYMELGFQRCRRYKGKFTGYDACLLAHRRVDAELDIYWYDAVDRGEYAYTWTDFKKFLRGGFGLPLKDHEQSSRVVHAMKDVDKCIVPIQEIVPLPTVTKVEVKSSEERKPGSDTKSTTVTVEEDVPLSGLNMQLKKVQDDACKTVDKVQRWSLFQTQCIIKGKACKLMIDGGSCTNGISKAMVAALGLSTWRLPEPKHLEWLNSCGMLKITHKVRVPFTVGDYVDEIDCDVLPLEVCGLLLGRPWQYDRNVTHAGRANTYSFMHGGKQRTLKPLGDDHIKSDVELVVRKEKLHKPNVQHKVHDVPSIDVGDVSAKPVDDKQVLVGDKPDEAPLIVDVDVAACAAVPVCVDVSTQTDDGC